MSAELDLAGRVVELARRLGGADAEAEVFVERNELALTRFANSFIHQNVAEATTTVRLRLHVDGRTATGSTTVLTDDGLRGLAERALTAARLCPPDPAWPGLAPPAPLAGPGNWDEATAQASPDERAARVRAFVDAARGLESAGYCRTLARAGGFANTAGQSASGRATEAAMDAIARGGGADGVARLSAGRLAELDGALLGTRAVSKARAGGAPVELPPGRYEVVLEPTAVADLLSNLAMYGFNGKAYNERRSFAEPGAQQFDPAITLIDDPLGPTDLGLPFDAEGTPKRRLTLVDAGLTAAVAHDRRTAADAGTASTGHALPGGSAGGAVPLNLRLAAEPGPAGAATDVTGPAADADAAALVADVERGLLVTDLWYTRVLDPKSLVVTGLTRNGVWLVEDGRIVSPVQNLRFTQSYPQALAPGAVRGVGRHATTVPDNWGGAWWSAPALRLAAWNFTGGASG
ncbi:Predicted Zn-dependent protease or its inactivated homolog [Micromonospora pattaloongensis]|uniref:Predicted Zn-dependent protease or its inactivated homolog n=1 Tax=Micromonospora pattaloongensis TaxID=405436 RepID=A0A1H3G6F3_9ACTN|nr:metallopeptidase TldD-related protein [Micromonospora pattaloongensis]SDX98856.1 Predicted Zn-dependent protease or its inactivated homolog [Micromonospora pattaloongensis]